MKLEDARAAGAFEPDLTLWDAWRPEQVAARLEGVRAPWYVAAGWAMESSSASSEESTKI